MARSKEKDTECCTDKKGSYVNGSGGAIYGFAFIGAAVYFIQHAETFWMGVLGVLKAIVWPAIVIYKILEFWKM